MNNSQPATQLQRDLVLVGGGHSHVLALRMLAMQPVAGLRIILISPASHSPYSGMLPGLIAGHYSFEQSHIDLARLCQWAGVRFITAEVIGLDPAARCLKLAGRPTVAYDVVSIDIGSQPELDTVPGARQHAIPVKPVAQLWQRWQDLCWRLAGRASGENTRIAVVGGGAGSVELVLAMAHRLQAEPVSFDLWCAASEILPGYSARARRSVMTQLQRHGITVHCNARVAAVGSSELTLAGGTQAQYDELFWCTGAAPAPWIAASGLATDEQGFLAVRDTLQATHDDRVFGAGDIAVQVNHPRPKAGVYAVRQGPVLAHNLRAFFLHNALQQHRPQRHFLSLLSLGARRATADRGIFTATGHWVWRWKHRIDRKFMARFENLPRAMARGAQDSLPELQQVSRQPVCGGCGAKVGADALSAALMQLASDYPRHCTEGGDDAAVLPATQGVSVVQSLDILREIVSDPWQMGRIAAQHALSDLYACAARPHSALAAITLPYASAMMLQRELEQLLAGALHEFAAADCRLLGGHSMQGAELAVGFVVNGVPMDRSGALLSTAGAKPGDQLVLTKALGTGTLFAAHMQLKADGRDVSATTEAMLRGNREAAQLALARGATACTDITGFGLLGHLLEMLSGECGAHLNLSQLPVLDGALDQLRAGRVSTMHAANVRSAQSFLQPSSEVDEARRQILFDPQTSGGLLIAQPPEGAQALCDALRRSGYAQASIIGEVTAPAPGATPSVQLE